MLIIAAVDCLRGPAITQVDTQIKILIDRPFSPVSLALHDQHMKLCLLRTFPILSETLNAKNTRMTILQVHALAQLEDCLVKTKIQLRFPDYHRLDDFGQIK